MKWTTFKLGGVQLTHVKQDDNSNQCVAASLAMVCDNTGYSGHKFGEGTLFSEGQKAMKATNNDNWASNISSKQFVTRYGIKPNAVTTYLTNYGFTDVSEVKADDGAKELAAAINGMNNGDSGILACGVDQFHAFAIFKLKGATYVLNPMPGDDSLRGVCYRDNKAAVEVNQNAVYFAEPDHGTPSFRTVNYFYKIPSQTYLGTVKRWYFG